MRRLRLKPLLRDHITGSYTVFVIKLCLLTVKFTQKYRDCKTKPNIYDYFDTAVKYEFGFNDAHVLFKCKVGKRNPVLVKTKTVHAFTNHLVLFIAAQFMEFDLDNSGDIGRPTIWHILFLSVSFSRALVFCMTSVASLRVGPGMYPSKLLHYFPWTYSPECLCSGISTDLP